MTDWSYGPQPSLVALRIVKCLLRLSGAGLKGGAAVLTQPAEYDLKSLSLVKLIAAWTDLILLAGVRPMLEYMVKADLSLPESIVLRFLQHGPFNVADVAICISITQSAASRAVDRLVRDGYVERHENPDDRRQKQLTLTREGQALVDRINGAMGEAAAPMLGGLSDEEQDHLRVLLAKMISAPGACPMTPCAAEPGRQTVGA